MNDGFSETKGPAVGAGSDEPRSHAGAALAATTDRPAVGERATAAVHLDRGPEGLLYLTFDTPGKKVNIFSFDALEQLDQVLDEIGRMSDATCVLARSFKPDCFIAGADLESIAGAEHKTAAVEASRMGQAVFAKVETLRLPVLAAINGVCLGGGTEFALACHFRLASDSPAVRIGLPEVKLGILPAWGGTQRLPKIVGLARALDLILSGRSIDGRRARTIGLVDDVVPKELFADYSVSYLEKQVAAGRGPRRAKPKLKPAERALESNRLTRRIIYDKAAASVFKTTQGHYPAPPKALEAIKVGIERGNRAGYLLESTFVGELVTGPVCKSLVQLFFATEAVKRAKHVTGREVEPLPVRKAAVLGAGVMGGGIAQIITHKDIPVRIKDLNPEAIAGAMRQASSVYGRRLKRRRMSQREFNQKMGLIRPTLDYSGFKRVDVVVEAIVENIEIKRRVFAELEDYVREDCIVASNTSSLMIGDMASAFLHPERFCGMHFFNPVDRMPLVEVIRGPQTSDVAVETIYNLSRKIGKTPIVVADRPGFLVNRILMPYLNEACLLLEEGASIDQVDQVMVNFGMPMGPLRLLDEIGLDVAQHAAGVLTSAFSDHLQPAALLAAAGADDRLGRKNGRGFYNYADPKKPVVDPTIYDVVRRATADANRPEPGSVVFDNILDRLLLQMLNEAARCLDEKVVATPTDVDLGLVMGTGFPPFRGGLLRYVDHEGLDEAVDKLRALAGEGRSRYAPAPLLEEMVRTRRRFYHG